MTTTTTPTRAYGLRALPPLAWWPVGGIGLATTLLLLAVSGRYGYHRDELYFRQLSESPAWGYVDQPPLTPFLAGVAIDVLGDEVWALRVPAAVLAGVLAVLLALVAREVGGRGVAQTVAALGAGSATPLISGHILLTASVDWPLWILVSLFAMRALLRRQPAWWVAAGVVAGLATYNKWLIVLLLLGLAGGLLLVGPKRVLRDRWLWAGVGALVVLALPNIVYQLSNGVPQAQMLGSLTGDAARLIFVPAQALAIGPPAVLLWGAGLVALLRREDLRPVRSFAVAYLLVCGLLIALAGQFYYTVGLLLVLYAVGAAVAERWVADEDAKRRARSGHLWRLVGINVVTSALVALPLLPVGVLGQTPVPLMNPAAGDQVGWPEYTAQVAAAYRTLPPQQQDGAVLIADNYGESGALDRYGPELGLPEVYSGHNSLYDLRRPPQDARVAVVVVQGDRSAAFLDTVFRTCRDAGVLDNGLQVGNEEQGTVIRVCEDPLAGWAQLWPSWRYVGLSTFCEPCRRLNL